jgi:hypothetical protein
LKKTTPFSHFGFGLVWFVSLLLSLNVYVSAITAAHANFVASAHPVDLFNNLLNSILLVAESPYGFIAEVKHTEKGDPYLQTFSITNARY